MNYPIDLSFKILALASQIYVRDASGRLVAYVKQKLFKLREDINVFADESQTQLLYNIKADRIIDFSGRYLFTDSKGKALGSVKRKGMPSIFKAHYEIYDPSGKQVMQINEENPWVKVADAILREIPLVGILSSYVFHPSYLVSRVNEKQVARLEKKPAFFEGKFQLTALEDLSSADEQLVLLSILMMTLLERSRG